jgi:hypothetical protein
MGIFQTAMLPVLNAVQETYVRAERENPGELDVDGDIPNAR